MAHDLTALELIEIRLALEDLNTAFTHHLDHNEVDELADLFTDDVLYTHGPRRSEGRAAVERLFRGRIAAGPRTSRHLYSGLKFDIESRTRATGTSVCMTFGRDGMPPLAPAVPILVADFNDVYVRCDDGRWRIRERHIERIFVDPDAGGPVGYRPSEFPDGAGAGIRGSVTGGRVGAAAEAGVGPIEGERRTGPPISRTGAGREFEVDLSLEPPSAYLFTGEICTRSYRLNRFAFDFKDPAVRERFAADPESLMDEYGLDGDEKALVRARDWTGLVARGGHHFNVIKIAAAVGETHLHVGAHMCGADWDELEQSLPHRVELMPDDVDR